MPTFLICPVDDMDCDSFWVYALDDFDAREQIARTLRVDASDEGRFEASEVTLFKMPLNIILHSSGEWTQVPAPKEVLCFSDDNGGGENPEA